MTIAVALSGCAAEPALEESSLRRAADEYIATYNDWDSARLTALFRDARPTDPYRAHFAWTRERIGACGSPRLMWQVGRQKAGFSYPCERGSLYEYFSLDGDGRLLKTNGGAADLAAEGALATQLQVVLDAMPGAPGLLAAQPWARPLTQDWVRARGRCQLGRTVVVGAYSGAFELSCERKSLTMKLVLNTDGEIRTVQFWSEPQDYSTVYFPAPAG